MEKLEFLRRLEEALLELPAEERAGAIQYYTEYIEEAGPESEAQVLGHLGSPEKIAAEIKKAAGAENSPGQQAPGREKPAQAAGGEYTPELTLNPQPFRYWEKAAPATENEPPAPQPGPAPAKAPGPGYPPTPGYAHGGYASQEHRRPDTAKIVILLVLAFIFWPVALGVLVTLVTLALLPFILAFGFGICSIALFASPFAIGGVGAAGAIFAAGLGLVFLGLTLLCGFLGVMLFSRMLPAAFRAVRKIFVPAARRSA